MVSSIVIPDLNSLRGSVGVPTETRNDIPEIEAIVDIVPQSRTPEDITFTFALLASETVGAFTVLPRVSVTVGVEVEHDVVGGGTLDLEACS